MNKSAIKKTGRTKRHNIKKRTTKTLKKNNKIKQRTIKKQTKSVHKKSKKTMQIKKNKSDLLNPIVLFWDWFISKDAPHWNEHNIKQEINKQIKLEINVLRDELKKELAKNMNDNQKILKLKQELNQKYLISKQAKLLSHKELKNSLYLTNRLPASSLGSSSSFYVSSKHKPMRKSTHKLEPVIALDKPLSPADSIVSSSKRNKEESSVLPDVSMELNMPSSKRSSILDTDNSKGYSTDMSLRELSAISEEINSN